MLRSNGECILVIREAMCQLRPNSSIGQWAQCMVVGGSKGFTFVIPVSFNIDNLVKQEKHISLDGNKNKTPSRLPAYYVKFKG